jgi:hypothetical protein
MPVQLPVILDFAALVSFPFIAGRFEQSRKRPFSATISSAFYISRQTTSASVMQSLDESQKPSHNQNLNTLLYRRES